MHECYILTFHAIADRHSGCFHFRVIMNNITMNNLDQSPGEHTVCTSVELKVSLSLILLMMSICTNGT